MKERIVGLLLVLVVGMTACGQAGPAPAAATNAAGRTGSMAEPAPTEVQRVQIPDTKVPLFVEVHVNDRARGADDDAWNGIPCEVRLAWADGQKASREAPWTGSIPLGEATKVTFQLWGPRAVDLDFAYLVARVTPRAETEGRFRFDIDTTCYACIR